MLIGPVTLSTLAQLEDLTVEECSKMLLPAYSELLGELKKLGVRTCTDAPCAYGLFLCK